MTRPYDRDEIILYRAEAMWSGRARIDACRLVFYVNATYEEVAGAPHRGAKPFENEWGGFSWTDGDWRLTGRNNGMIDGRLASTAELAAHLVEPGDSGVQWRLTWDEAYSDLARWLADKLERLQKDLDCCRADVERVKTMQPPPFATKGSKP